MDRLKRFDVRTGVRRAKKVAFFQAFKGALLGLPLFNRLRAEQRDNRDPQNSLPFAMNQGRRVLIIAPAEDDDRCVLQCYFLRLGACRNSYRPLCS